MPSRNRKRWSRVKWRRMMAPSRRQVELETTGRLERLMIESLAYATAEPPVPPLRAIEPGDSIEEAEAIVEAQIRSYSARLRAQALAMVTPGSPSVGLNRYYRRYPVALEPADHTPSGVW